MWACYQKTGTRNYTETFNIACYNDFRMTFMCLFCQNMVSVFKVLKKNHNFVFVKCNYMYEKLNIDILQINFLIKLVYTMAKTESILLTDFIRYLSNLKTHSKCLLLTCYCPYLFIFAQNKF